MCKGGPRVLVLMQSRPVSAEGLQLERLTRWGNAEKTAGKKVKEGESDYKFLLAKENM